MDNNEIQKQEQKLIENLLLVKEDYIKCKDLLAVSIRKDLLLIELKDMLINNVDFFSLKAALEEYIEKIEGEINGRNNKRSI